MDELRQILCMWVALFLLCVSLKRWWFIRSVLILHLHTIWIFSYEICTRRDISSPMHHQQAPLFRQITKKHFPQTLDGWQIWSVRRLETSSTPLLHKSRTGQVLCLDVQIGALNLARVSSDLHSCKNGNNLLANNLWGTCKIYGHLYGPIKRETAPVIF